MREVSFEESQTICLQILKFFDSFCRENHIVYSLGEGTLLGAVRHKGFIPWDDDIDLLMERSELEKFLSLYKAGPYDVFVPGEHKDWWCGVVRLTDPQTSLVFDNPADGHHGLWIALTPVDHAPDAENDWNAIKRKRIFWKTLCCYKVEAIKHPKSLKGRLGKFVSRFLSIKWLNKQYVNTLSSFNSVETKRRMKIRLKGDPLLFPAEIMSEYTELEFEGQKFMAISHYDEYLRIMYGDYMTPPPESERVPKHSFKAYFVG